MYRALKSSYDLSELDDLIKDLKIYEQDLEQAFRSGVGDVTLDCATDAQDRFANAVYDGQNDVVVTVTEKKSGRNSTEAVVRASSNQEVPVTLFIEYGTGVYNYDGHPEKPPIVLRRGEYGHHLGKLRGWRYKGVPGTNGVPDASHPGYIYTRGNMSNMCMYKAKMEVLSSRKTVATVEAKLKGVTD